MSAKQRSQCLPVTRRMFLRAGSAVAAGVAVGRCGTAADRVAAADRQPTEFQIACMTLPYSAFPLERALTGIQGAGYRYVAWGTTHQQPGGSRVPVMPPDAPPRKAGELAKRCRGLGLEPLLMFSPVYPEAPDAAAIMTSRIKQAAAARIPQVLTFGHTQGGNRRVWIERFKALGPIARDHGLMIVIKQHGGAIGTGVACAELVQEVSDPAIKVNYDAGNVMDYLNVDPIADLGKCAASVRSFCIKDHRRWPKSQDCGPGFGEIDHYRLLSSVTFTGLAVPLCCENIFAPLVPRPAKPEEIDVLARRAREFLEVVVAGLQQTAPSS